METKFSGWKVAAALWLIIFVNLAFTSYGAGVIGAFMLGDLKIGRSVLGLGFTVLALSQGLAAPLVACAVNRIGARLTLTYGSLSLASAAFALAYFSSAGWHYVVAFGVGIGISIAFSTLIPVQTCVAMWFSKKRGLALAVVLSATGVGGFVAAPLLNQIIMSSSGSWRAGWYFISMLALLSALVAFLFVRNRPGDLGQVPDGASESNSKRVGRAAEAAERMVYRSTIDWSVAEAVRTRTKWLIALASIGFAMPISAFLAHGVPHLIDIGHSPAIAALALGTVAMVGAVGKLCAGYLCDRMEPRYVWFAFLLMAAAGIALSISARDPLVIYAFAALLGAGYGGSLVCWPTMLANYFGAKSFASIMGMQFPLNALGSCMAPLLVGMAFDRLGGYGEAFLAIAALTLSAALLLLIATPPKMACDKPATAAA